MNQTLAYKYRMYPTKTQEQMFLGLFGCTRFLYNELLSWWKNEIEQAKKENRKADKLPLATFFKERHPFLCEADSLALMNARRRFETAVDSFYKKRSRFPKFRKRGKCKESYTTSKVRENLLVLTNCIKLPKVGKVKCAIHRELPSDAKILSATVSRTSDGKYWVSVVFKTDILFTERAVGQPKVVGLDMSMKEFCISSDGDGDVARTKYVRRFRESERRIAKLSRRVSKKNLVSRNRDKARKRLGAVYQKVANRRRDFVIKQALFFARNYDVVVVEDIDMKAMSRTLNLGKSVMDLGFGEFMKWLDWQCKKHGVRVVRADRWFPSSKRCNHCGHVNKGLRLSDRVWVCPECGAEIDRDYNAACNLRDWYLWNNNTAGTAEIDASGEWVSTGTATCRQVCSPKEEAAMCSTSR